MMKFLLSVSLFVPSVAFAQTTYKLLAPLGPLSGDVTLQAYLEGILLVTIGVAGILAVLMIVICGIQMIGSPSVSQKTAAKECVWNAIFGLLLAISSWIILNTINQQLLSSDFTPLALPAPPAPPPASTVDAPIPSLPGWYFRYREAAGGKIFNSPRWPTPESCLEALKQEKADGRIIEQTPAGSNKECFEVFPPPPGAPPPPPGSPPVIAPPATEAAARIAVCGNDSCIGATPVAVKQGPCPPSIGNCAKAGYINMAGMPMSAINAIKALASGSGQNVVITGGTESGHKTHLPNAPIFDLRKTPALDAWIRQNSTQSAVSFYPCRYRITLGGSTFWFTDEGNHWHNCQLGQPFWYCTDNQKNGQPLPAGFYSNCPK